MPGGNVSTTWRGPARAPLRLRTNALRHVTPTSILATSRRNALRAWTQAGVVRPSSSRQGDGTVDRSSCELPAGRWDGAVCPEGSRPAGGAGIVRPASSRQPDGTVDRSSCELPAERRRKEPDESSLARHRCSAQIVLASPESTVIPFRTYKCRRSGHRLASRRISHEAREWHEVCGGSF